MEKLVTIEVGSTITKLNCFVKIDNSLELLAQEFTPTTVDLGDVGIGVDAVLSQIKDKIEWPQVECFINSSAAGGLKMSVHGLTLSMTTRAAKEASLGAGAIIKKMTVGKISSYDLEELEKKDLNLILLAGGVDHGETEIPAYNAEILFANPRIHVPIIYAGNVVLHPLIKKWGEKYQKKYFLCENVFPGIDELNVTPVRKIIQQAFSEHITHAKGMERIASFSSYPVLPTPGAVLNAAQIYYELFGDTLVMDVGGATTDVHSITLGSSEYQKLLLDPEPIAKRTVEGDLGVYVNASSVLMLDQSGTLKSQMNYLKALPDTMESKKLSSELCLQAALVGIKRHCGSVTEFFTATGKKKMVQGKDLSAIKNIVGTGGALGKLENGRWILSQLCNPVQNYLLPSPQAKIIIDSYYLFSALGTISPVYPELVKNTLKKLYGI